MTKNRPDETWLVVADASRARIFAADVPLEEVREIHALVHEASRLRASERTSDGRGSIRDTATGMHTAYESHSDLQRVESARFAKEVADYLYRAVNENRFLDLVLAAPPHFLGQLRSELHPTVAARINATVDRDYTRVPEHQIGETLRQRLTA